MTDTLRYALVILGAVLIAAFWPRWRVYPPDEVALSREAANKLEPSYRWATDSEMAEMAGVYLRDGQPRYTLRGVDVTAEEFRRARSPEEWDQAQAWIREQQSTVVR